MSSCCVVSPNFASLRPACHKHHAIADNSATPNALTKIIDHLAKPADIWDSSTSISMCPPVRDPKGIDSATIKTRESTRRSSAPVIGAFNAFRMINTFQTENPVMKTRVNPPKIKETQVSILSIALINAGLVSCTILESAR